jgi:CheY-like chemotaxis protein
MADRTVMVVEDDALSREMVSTLLACEGYDAVGAANGAEALRTLWRDGVQPAVILLDLAMPVMDGRQFRAAQLADPALAEIPVVLISATDAGEVPADARVPKPIDVDALLAAVSRLTART